MVVRCMTHQNPGDTCNACKRCDGDTKWGCTYCALCMIQEELGMWCRPEWDKHGYVIEA